MKKYEDALHTWFFKNSGLPSTSAYSGGGTDYAKTQEFIAHRADFECTLTWEQNPEFDTEQVWNGTYDPNHRITVLDAVVSCSCEEGGYAHQILRYTGETESLSDIILAVLAEGDSEG